MTEPSPESPHRLEAQRKENRQAVRALGADPYGERTTGLSTIAQARAAYDPGADAEQQASAAAAKSDPSLTVIDRRPVVKVAGRVMLKRDGGKLIWLQLRDHTSGPANAPGGTAESSPPCKTSSGGTAESSQPCSSQFGPDSAMAADLQVAVSARDCAQPGAGFDVAKLLDLGDIVIAEGPVMKTKAGEVTIWASKLTMASKSVAPPPEKWSGLQDPEVRYRRRYVDLYANPQTMQVAVMRARLVSVIRRYLEDLGYMEVETPTLQTLAGGAAARPFVTHINALDIDLFMRVAPELYLKRLLVGGMPRVFEWSRNFRNEGVDRSHNPEFTMLELYEAFADYTVMMDIFEGLIRACAGAVKQAWHAPSSAASPLGHSATSKDLTLPYNDLRIDYARPFARVSYEALFEKAWGFSMNDSQKVRAAAKKAGHKTDGVADILLINELFDRAEEAIDPSTPTFLVDYPAELCPLTRSKKGRPEIAERFELFIGGMELGNAYTELNDPDIQEAKFREQLQGVNAEESTFRTFDEDFVYALKVGMPPAGGLGIGIDRLMMLLLNQKSIRDVLLFPLMKPVE